jgi:hypothetical protein
MFNLSWRLLRRAVVVGKTDSVRAVPFCEQSALRSQVQSLCVLVMVPPFDDVTTVDL